MPTPSPIMMPRNVAKSGIVMRLLSRLMMATPMPMPNRATPTGKPHRQDRAERHDQDDDRECEAEDLGGRLLELGEDEPAQLDLQPFDLRYASLDLFRDLGGAREIDVVGQFDVGVRDLARFRALRRDQ